MSAVEQGRLVDCRGIMAELGVKRATAEAIMRQLVKVEIAGVRKSFVYRDHVEKLIRDSESGP